MAEHRHWEDTELLLALEAGEELPLENCTRCKRRWEELKESLSEAEEAIGGKSVGQSKGAEAALRERMRESKNGWRWAVAMLACSLGIMAILVKEWEPRGPLPNGRLTPGETTTEQREAACAEPMQDEGKLIEAELAQRVFAAYGVQSPMRRTYEIDFLISPALGGAKSVRNLWPISYREGIWTSRVKDALEAHLRQEVCQGRVDLREAQRELAEDWIAAYKKHFQSARPISNHTLYSKDSPWE